MNNTSHKIKQEWERAVLIAVLFLILVCLGITYASLQNRKKPTEEFHSLRTPYEYFDTKSKVYMSAPGLDAKARSPLAYSLKVKIPPAQVKPQTKPQAKPQTKPQAKPQVKPQAKPVAQEKPVPPPEKISVLYRGCMQFENEPTVVFCTSVSDKDKRTNMASLHQGDKIHGHFTIEEISPANLKLTYKGESISIQRGKASVIVLK